MLVEALCQRLRVPNPVRDLAKLVAEYHDLIHTVNKLRPETLLKLFDAIDVWRKPQRLEQMILTSEADARGRTGFENNPYPQGDYLRQAYQVANAVSVKEVVESGLQGLAIRDEVKRRRQQALADWKKQQEPQS
ncbi:Multifunctional CCA protein [compost metagenome]